ncbi:MAG TPA: DUF2142 domain-containing protein [Actinospica sp.]|nr:DUF2142 domain-containing protein [Actinospica sp.]
MFRKPTPAKPLLALLAFLALALSWSLGTPLLSAADEPEQSIKAAAVVRGEFSGAEHVWNFSGWQSTYTTPDYLEIRYHLPHSLAVALAEHDPACYAFTTQSTPTCTVHANKHKVAKAGDSALSHMNYSPLYYVLVGWPSLLFHGSAALYAMRVVSALMTALLLAAAFTTSARRGRTAAVGVVAAVTPAAVYFGSVVNPSGLEITSALLAWASLISMTQVEPGDRARGSDRVMFTIAAATLVLVRPLGPVWLAAIVAAVLTMSPEPRERIRQALRVRDIRWTAGLIGAALLATAAWDVTQNTMGIIKHVNPTYTMAKGVYLTLNQTPQFLAQMVGLIGWNDVHEPTATTYLWYGAVIGLVLAAIVIGGRRERLVLLALAALVLLFPLAFEAYSGAAYGVGWQGRYTLPLAIGLPLLAAEVLGRRMRRADLGSIPRSLAATLGSALALAYLCEVWWAWRRYAQGLGPLSHYLPFSAKWVPVIGWPMTLLLALGGTLGLLALITARSFFEGRGEDAPRIPAQAPAGSPGADPLVSRL